jgi:hypothetical protein
MGRILFSAKVWNLRRNEDVWIGSVAHAISVAMTSFPGN